MRRALQAAEEKTVAFEARGQKAAWAQKEADRLAENQRRGGWKTLEARRRQMVVEWDGAQKMNRQVAQRAAKVKGARQRGVAMGEAPTGRQFSSGAREDPAARRFDWELSRRTRGRRPRGFLLGVPASNGQ